MTKITIDKALIEQVLEAMDAVVLSYGTSLSDTASYIDAKQELREALAEPAPEPVATITSWTNGSYWRNYKVEWHNGCLPEGTKLYAAPVREPAPEKKGLFVDLIAQHPGLAEELAAMDVPAPVQKPAKKLWLQRGVFPDLAGFDTNGLPRFYSKESADKFQIGQCSKPCAGKNCGSMNGWMHSIECRAEHEAVITAPQAQPALVQEPVAWWKQYPDGNVSVIGGKVFLTEDALYRGWRPLGFADAQPRKAVKLSDDEVEALFLAHAGYGGNDFWAVSRAVEQAVWAKLGVTE